MRQYFADQFITIIGIVAELGWVEVEIFKQIGKVIFRFSTQGTTFDFS